MSIKGRLLIGERRAAAGAIDLRLRSGDVGAAHLLHHWQRREPVAAGCLEIVRVSRDFASIEYDDGNEFGKTDVFGNTLRAPQSSVGRGKVALR